MKIFTRAAALLMALLMLFAAGCGSSSSLKPKVEISLSDSVSDELAQTAEETAETVAEAVEETADETAAEETESAEPEQNEAPAFVPKGRVENEPARMPARLTLRELGSPEDGEGTLSFRSDDLFVRYERDDEGNVLYYAVDHMGKTLSEEKYDDFEELFEGVYLVRAVTENINNTGLMLESGELLIDCDAAIITPVYNNFSDDGQRFLLVVYGTEMTENEDEAFFYATESMFSIKPQEGDVYYKGYAKIYDLESRSFVPGLIVNNSDKYASESGGSCFCYTDENGVTTLYNGAGDAVYSSSSASIDIGRGFALIDYTKVVDDKGQTLFESEDYLSVLSGSGQYLCKYGYGEDETVVYDYFGNVIFSVPGDNRITSDGGGYFCGSNGDEGLLFDAQGNIVARASNGYAPSYEGYGIWMFYSMTDGVKTSYYLADGNTVTPDGSAAYGLVNELEEPEDGSVGIFPWNAPEEALTFPGSYMLKLTDGLVVISGDKDTLVDCFSGEILITADSIEFADSRYIYVKNDGVLTIYELVAEY